MYIYILNTPMLIQDNLQKLRHKYFSDKTLRIYPQRNYPLVRSIV